MALIVRDSYKTEVRIGAKVAYNYQGEVRVGVVQEIVPSTRKRYGDRDKDYHGNSYVVIHVKEVALKTISKVSNPRNLVVLYEK